MPLLVSEVHKVDVCIFAYCLSALYLHHFFCMLLEKILLLLWDRFQFLRVLTAFLQLQEAGSRDISLFWRGTTAELQLGNSTLGCRHQPKPFSALLLLFALAEGHWLPNEMQQGTNHKSVGHDVKVKCGFFTLPMHLSTSLWDAESLS